MPFVSEKVLSVVLDSSSGDKAYWLIRCEAKLQASALRKLCSRKSILV